LAIRLNTALMARAGYSLASRRHGVSIVYISLIMLAMLGFCSLAVDLARVQSAKTQLEITCDAAARAGAAAISSGVSAVQAAAANVAAANSTDGNPVTIDSINNVVFLNWPSTTPLTGSARAGANAIQVNASLQVPTLFAMAIGRSTATVHGSSTAQVVNLAGPGTYQILGLNSYEDFGAVTDSWNSSSGPYNASTAHSNGSIASNGLIWIYSPAVVHGSMYYTSGNTPNNYGATIMGSTTQMASPIPVPPMPTIPAGCTNLGAADIPYESTMTLNSGNYSCTSFTFQYYSTLVINATSGPVNLYCSGSIDDSVGTVINTIPSNFNIYMTGTSTEFDIGNGFSLYATIYAPGSAIYNYGGQLFGSFVGQSIQCSDGSGMHFDEALGTNGPTSAGTTVISQVQ
jgi:enamine deaminase RidA (YjgF/YER057c/UK114 family)